MRRGGRAIQGWINRIGCLYFLYPGDYMIADGSGVVFIPTARIEEILTLAETIAHKKCLMTQDVLAGKPVSVVMGANYENMLE